MKRGCEDVGIYQIRNLINNKVYIGQSINLKIRKYQHFKSLMDNKHYNKHLQGSWNKFGSESFVFEILVYCEKNELTYYEQKLVDKLNPDYNICKECVDSPKGVNFDTWNDERRKSTVEKMKKSWTPERRLRQSEMSKNYIKNNGGRPNKKVKKPISEKQKIDYYCEKCGKFLEKKSRMHCLCQDCYKEKRRFDQNRSNRKSMRRIRKNKGE